MPDIQTPDADAAREQAARILQSAEFANAHRDRDFLRFVCEETIEGRGAELKETTIALRVFGRGSNFDARVDSVVRVVAGHVRKRLDRYYLTEGAADRVRIEIPKGRYEAEFRVLKAPPPRNRWNWAIPLATVAVIAIACAGYLGFHWWEGRERTAIAVLPFLSLDGRAETGYLASGISEDVATELARSADLRVIGGLSGAAGRGEAGDLRALGRQSGAGTLLRGTVRRDGDLVRITAQLLHTADGVDLWADSFEGPPALVPEFQDRITQNVRRVLKVKSKSAEPARAFPVAAQEEYWQGRFLLRKGATGRASSLSHLNAAIRIAPGFLQAHAALATAYSTMAFHGEGNWREMAVQAKTAARHALELDPDSAEALVALATLEYGREHDWPRAEAHFQRALAASPNSARVHTAYGLGLLSRGRIDQALRQIRQAHELEPLSALSGNELAVALYCARRYRESLETTGRILSVRADFAPAYVARGMCLTELGDFRGARAELEKAIALIGRDAAVLGPLGNNQARAGDRATAEALLAEISAGGGAFQSAVVAAGLGNRERALELLQRAVQNEETDAAFLAALPTFTGLRDDARFQRLLDRNGR